MGSLMAGWDAPVPDPNIVKYRRNRSLTKEEIEAFWKSKKRKEEEHLRDISLLSPRSQQEITFQEAKRRNRRASSEPIPTTTAKELETDDTSLEKIIQKHGWWISTNWAFLNEPPVITSEGDAAHKYAAHKYASQFHVAGSPVHPHHTGGTDAACDISGLD